MRAVVFLHVKVERLADHSSPGILELLLLVRRLAQLLPAGRERCTALEWCSPGQHLVEQDTQGIEITAGAGRLLYQFWRHILGSAYHISRLSDLLSTLGP